LRDEEKLEEDALKRLKRVPFFEPFI